MKNRFKKKEPDLRELDHLWALLESEKYDEVICGAEKLLNHHSEALAKDAAKLLGMAFFKQEKYQKALPYFQRAAQFNAEVNDWFNVMTSAVLSRDLEVARDAFDRTVQLQLERGHKESPSIPFTRYYYACALRDAREYQLALEQINELRSIYEQLKITDTTFVYLRGVPFLSHTMDVAVDVFNGLGASFNANAWIDNFAAKLDEEGQGYLNAVKVRLRR